MTAGGPLWNRLPDTWSVSHIGRLAEVTLGKMLQPADRGGDLRAPYLRAANVQPDGLLQLDDVNEMWFRHAELRVLNLRTGDVIVVEGGQGGFGRAAFLTAPLDGWGFQNSINRLRPRPEVDGRFVAYYLIALRASGFIRAYCNIVSMPHLTAEKLAAIPIPLPPTRVQGAIADYLDRETAQIDTLIAKQEQLIATLRERRESTVATILQAGLNPETPTRESEVGRVPKHWRVVPARHLCTITTGDEDSGSATEVGQYPLFVRGREVLRIDRYSFDGEAVMTPGDGQGGTGKVFHYFNGRFAAHQRVYVFKDFHGVSGRYFYYYLSAFLRPRALANSNTVTMESIRRPVLADFKVTVPPADELADIVSYLDRALDSIDSLVAKVERFIELAKERRSALITAAVTGQIDVSAA